LKWPLLKAGEKGALFVIYAPKMFKKLSFMMQKYAFISYGG